MAQPDSLRLKTVDATEVETEELNKPCTMIEFEHAYDMIRKEKVHGKIEVTFVDGEADILRREINIKLPRSPRKKPSLA